MHMHLHIPCFLCRHYNIPRIEGNKFGGRLLHETMCYCVQTMREFVCVHTTKRGGRPVTRVQRCHNMLRRNTAHVSSPTPCSPHVHACRRGLRGLGLRVRAITFNANTAAHPANVSNLHCKCPLDAVPSPSDVLSLRFLVFTCSWTVGIRSHTEIRDIKNQITASYNIV